MEMISRAVRLAICGVVLMLASCKLEPCKDYRCVNGLALEDGKNCICLCDLGWDGIDCTVEDKCVTNQVVCLNGYCNNSGVCVCNQGYEGDSCQLLSRNRFLIAGDSSRWTVADTCASAVFSYVAELKPGADNRTLEVYNIRELGSSQFIIAHVNKQVCEQRTNKLIGNVEIRNFKGTLSSDSTVLRVSYLSDEGFTVSCKGTWLRN